MSKAYIADLTHKIDGIENTENFVLTDVPATLCENAVLCALLLCIWDNETSIQDRLDELEDGDDVGYEVTRLVNDFNNSHLEVCDRNDDMYSIDRIDPLTNEEAKAFKLLSPRLSTPCYTFFIFETMFNFAKKVELNSGEETYYELKVGNPLIYNLLKFYEEKLNQGADQYDAKWLDEINAMFNI